MPKQVETRKQAARKRQAGKNNKQRQMFYVLGIATPIGSDFEAFFDCVRATFSGVGYKVIHVHLIKLIVPKNETPKPDWLEQHNSLIDKGNAFRATHNDNAALAWEGIQEIRRLRTLHSSKPCVFVVQSLKRKEEVIAFRSVYGNNFFQISLNASTDDRVERIVNKIAASRRTTKRDQDRQNADTLIRSDQNQHEAHGQNLMDAFSMADLFIDCEDTQTIGNKVSRFVKLLHRDPKTTPTREEFGMYCASGAALRSGDLSRQIGAAILTTNGDIISMGCNEVPKAGGGQYWEGDTPDKRDIHMEADSNELARIDILSDSIDRFKKAGLIAKERDTRTLIEEILDDRNRLYGSFKVFEITEYGRAVHAEMAALTNAATLGRAVKDCILYTTTYPCHNCAKHIVASGIGKVVYIQPYPKSYVNKLHDDSITHKAEDSKRVLFKTFEGIAPVKYHNLFSFEKGERKQLIKNSKSGNGRTQRTKQGQHFGFDEQITLIIINHYEESAIEFWHDLKGTKNEIRK